MTETTNIPLDTLNTFTVPCIANNYFVIGDIHSLVELTKRYAPLLETGNFYLLGDGSNTLFINDSVDLVIKSALKGITITETANTFIVKAAAGESWHQLVVSCIHQGIYGLENLVLIPGSVGAAPVQNIGAYGAEIANFCTEVDWFSFKENIITTLSNKACNFGYRDSIFKHELKNKGMITAVTFTLPKQWSPNRLYQGLTTLHESATAKEIMEKVIHLRQSKLPDPKIMPNAGSFFKNPIISFEAFNLLSKQYEKLPSYPQTDGSVKLAAGWLIEQAGLKGVRHNTASIHIKQALVIINDFNGNGQNIVSLAKLVINAVHQQFGIKLEPEVRFVGSSGEYDSVNYISEYS